MSDLKFRPGAAVDPKRAVRFGALRVAEYRFYSMSKWLGAIFAYGLGNPVLYLISVGLGIGALVDANTGGQGILGVSYLQFVAPALLASAAIQGVMDEVTFPTMDGFVWDKLFYAINATSVSAIQIANGVMIVALGRGLFTVLMYLGVLLLFGAVPLTSVLPLIFTSMLAAWGWAALMLLFSGTFYPLELMPIYLQPLGWLSPLWHSTELGRTLSYGAEMEPSMFFIHIGYLAVMGVIGMALTYPKFVSRLAK